MAIFDVFKRKQRSFVPEISPVVQGALLFPGDKNPTVSACVDKIAKTLSTLPLNLYETTKNGMRQAVNNQLYHVLANPSFEETPTLFYRTCWRFLVNKGNVFLFKNKNTRGDLVGFQIVDPNRVDVTRDEAGRKRYLIGGTYYSDSDILHIPYPGPGFNGTVGKSPIDLHREIIELDNQLLSDIASYFNNSVGARLVINLGSTWPQRKGSLSQLYAEIVPVMNKFVLGPANAGKPMIGLPDSTVGKVDQTSNVQAELKSLLNMIEHQIAQSCFGVPYEILDSEASKYDSLESKQNDFLSSCIQPLGDHICESFEKLLSPGERLKMSVRYEYKNLLTTNTKDTVEYLMKEFQGGALTMNEVRKKLGMEDMGEAGDYHFIPSNLMPLTVENIQAYMAKSKLALEKAKNNDPKGDDKT